ncbi:Transport and Golgi organization protein 1 [Halotydeus destructor]|nr:Transport and Golgi organization protein 1 [Halotydeus destructor]
MCELPHSMQRNQRRYTSRTVAGCCKIWLVCCLSLTVIFGQSASEDVQSDQPALMLCADALCQVPISFGKTLATYPAKDPRYLSFKSGFDVTIYAKPADSKNSGAYGQIGDRKGLIPLNLVREEKVISKAVYTVHASGLIGKVPDKVGADQTVEVTTFPSGSHSLTNDVQDSVQSSPDESTEHVSPTELPAKREQDHIVEIPGGSRSSSSDKQDSVKSSIDESTEHVTPTEFPAKRERDHVVEIPGGSQSSTNDTQDSVQSSPGEPAEHVSPTESPAELKEDKIVEIPSGSQSASSDTQDSVQSSPDESTEHVSPTEFPAKRDQDHIVEIPSGSHVSTNDTQDSVQSSPGEPTEHVSPTESPVKLEQDKIVEIPKGSQSSSSDTLDSVKSSPDESTGHVSPTGLPAKPDQDHTVEMPGGSQSSTNDTQDSVQSSPGEPTEHVSPTESPAKLEEKIVEIPSGSQSSSSDTQPSGQSSPDEFTEYVSLTESPTKLEQDQIVEIPSESQSSTNDMQDSVKSSPDESSEHALLSEFPAKLEQGQIVETPSDNYSESRPVTYPPHSDEDILSPEPSHEPVQEKPVLTEPVPPLSKELNLEQPLLSVEQMEEKIPLTVNDIQGSCESSPDESCDRVLFSELSGKLEQDQIVEGPTNNYSEGDPLFGMIVLDRKESIAHASIATCVVGFLWIIMMVTKLRFYSNNKEKGLNNQVCSLQAAIYKLKAERACLKQELSIERKKVIELENCGMESGHKVGDLECSLSALEKEKASLHKQRDTIQSSLREKEEKCAELYDLVQKKADELLHLQNKLQTETKESQRLREVLKDSESKSELYETENLQLKEQIAELRETASKHSSDNQKLETELEDYQELAEKVETDLKHSQATVQRLTTELAQKENELESMRETFTQLDCYKKNTTDDVTEGWSDVDDVPDEAKFSSEQLFDYVKLKSELSSATKEKSELEHLLEVAVKEKAELEDQIDGAKRVKEDSEKSVELALKEREDAVKNLDVLTKYFKEREVELQRELGAQQVSRIQKEEDANSLYNRLKSIQEENEANKAQLDSMKKELGDTERNYKAQLATMEKRAHDNWVAARSAEREVDDLKRDASFLRQQLTTTFAKVSNDSVGDSANQNSLYDFAMMPPPPPPGVDMATLAMAGMAPPLPSFMEQVPSGAGSLESGPASGQWDNIPPPPMPPMPPFAMPDSFDTLGPLPNFAQPPFSMAGQMPAFGQQLSHHHSYSEIPTHHMPWEHPTARDAFSPVSHQSHDLRSSRGGSPRHSFGSQGGSYSSSIPYSGPPPNWNGPNGNAVPAMTSTPYKYGPERSDSRNSVSTSKLHQTGV